MPRRLGTLDGAGVVVASMVGSGIFAAAGFAAFGIDSAAILLGLWIVGGIYSFCGALCYAELATRLPEAGGEYVYLREAYGRTAGFLSGWISFTAGFSGAIAVFALAFIAFFSVLVPEWDSNHVIASFSIRDFTWDITIGRVAAIGVVIVGTLIHCIRLRVGMAFQNILTALKILAVIVFVALGLSSSGADWSRLGAGSGKFPELAALAGGLTAVLFSFSGWNAVGYMAEEMKDPQRSIVRALLIGTAVVTVLYLLINIVYVIAIPLAEFGKDDKIAHRAAETLLGADMGRYFAALFSFLLLATLGANMLTGPRVYFSMARDGLFPKAMCGGLNRWGVPQRAVILQGTVATVLLVSGGFQTLLYWVTFVINVSATLAVLSVVVLRYQKKGSQGFRVPLYPLPVIIFCAISVFFSIWIFWSFPGTSWKGLALINVGLLVYFFWKAFTGRREPDNKPG
jgi:APA family basic amino acid/polyamine antiporter